MAGVVSLVESTEYAMVTAVAQLGTPATRTVIATTGQAPDATPLVANGNNTAAAGGATQSGCPKGWSAAQLAFSEVVVLPFFW